MPKNLLSKQTYLEAACNYIETTYGIKINEISAEGLLQLLYDFHVHEIDYSDNFFALLDKNIGRYLINNESFFFRFPEQLKILADYVAKYNGNRLKILSFGCSAGQEVYSSAIYLENLRVDYEIIGLDIDPFSIKAAEEGIYSEYSLRKVKNPEDFFFKRENKYIIKSKYKTNVKFFLYNILQKPISSIINPGSVDVVFCNNVLIYLTENARSVVLKELHSVIKYGGKFMTTYEESHEKNITHLFKKEYFNDTFYFEKPDYRKLGFMDYRDLYDDENMESKQLIYEYMNEYVNEKELVKKAENAALKSNHREALNMYYTALKKFSFNYKYVYKLYEITYKMGYIYESKKWLKIYLICGEYDKNDLDKYLQLCLQTGDYLEYLRIMEKKVKMYYNKEDIYKIIDIYKSIGQEHMAEEFKKMI